MGLLEAFPFTETSYCIRNAIVDNFSSALKLYLLKFLQYDRPDLAGAYVCVHVCVLYVCVCVCIHVCACMSACVHTLADWKVNLK